MTALQYVENLLEAEWNNPSSSLNREPLPDIGDGVEVFRESAQNLRKMNPDEYDILLLRDGGVTNVEPQSVGWVEERLVSRVTIDIRTTGQAGAVDGRERLWGKRQAGNTAPDYGGLTGEVKRVLETVRNGDQEFDLIPVREMNDISDEMGGQIWRATVEIELDTRAYQPDP